VTHHTENPLEHRNSALLACLLVLAFSVYANTLFNGFLFDDHFQIERNTYLRNFHSIPRILATTGWSFQGSEGNSNVYRPALTIGFLFCYQAFGTSPLGYHLVSILLHVIVVWLVFAVAMELFGDFFAGLGSGLLFALHPIHTESVAWISGVNDIEMTLFFLLAFLCFLRLHAAAGLRSIILRAGMLTSFAIALLAKEAAITFPVLAAVYEHFYRAGHSNTAWKIKFGRYSGLWVVAAAYLLLRIFALGGVAPTQLHRDVTWPQAFFTCFSLTGEYLGKFFWPHPLSYYYPFHKSVTPADPHVLAGLCACLLCATLFVVLLKRARPYSFALFWILLTLAPALNARWMPGVVFAERYLYLPSVGFAWLSGGFLIRLWRSPSFFPRLQRPLLGGVALIVTLFAARETLSRNRDWNDDRTLVLRTLEVQPHSSYFLTNLGAIRWADGDTSEAERVWRQALAEDPQNPVALWDLGLALLEKQHYKEALSYLDEALAIGQRYALPHAYRGRVLAALGRNAEAEAELRRAVEIDPQQIVARNALGKFFLDGGRVAEAEAQYRASVENMQNLEAAKALAQIYTVRNSPSQAAEAWKQVLDLEPYDAQAHFQLGSIYLEGGNTAEAEKQFQAGLVMDPENAEALAAMRKLHHQELAAPRP
jgi:protein O-mannosyl-transferase